MPTNPWSSPDGDSSRVHAYIESLVEEQALLGTLEASFELSERAFLKCLEEIEADADIPAQEEGEETFWQRVLHSNKPTEYMASRIFTCLMFGWFLTTVFKYAL